MRPPIDVIKGAWKPEVLWDSLWAWRCWARDLRLRRLALQAAIWIEKMMKGGSIEQKQKLIAEIAQVSVEILGGAPDSIDIIITNDQARELGHRRQSLVRAALLMHGGVGVLMQSTP
jgi:phenylpyruvate tautomerase PptA (4-oxalocrotonate tautomerase family)